MIRQRRHGHQSPKKLSPAAFLKPETTMRSYVFAATLILAAAFTPKAGFAETPPTPPAAPAAPPALPVTVATPLAKRIAQWDEYWGRFQAVERVEVRSRVSGFVEQVHFKDGSLIKAGDLLFTIDMRPFQIAADIAKAEVARQEAQVNLATSEVERAEPLAKSKVLTDQEMEKRRSTLAVAQAQLLSAKANLKSADLNLEWSEVRAPISGRISDKKVDAGNLIAGGVAGATLLANIVSLDPIHFVFDVSESDYLRYSRLFLSGERPSSRETANPVKVKLADEATWLHDGRMDFVDNAMNERSGTLRGRAVFDNKNGLFTPGVFARLALFGGEADVLLVPDAAIVSDQAKKIVLIVNDDNVVVPVPIVLGLMADGLRIVKSGLKGGEKIIIEGIANPMVRPGTKVAPQNGAITTVVSK